MNVCDVSVSCVPAARALGRAAVVVGGGGAAARRGRRARAAAGGRGRLDARHELLGPRVAHRHRRLALLRQPERPELVQHDVALAHLRNRINVTAPITFCPTEVGLNGLLVYHQVICLLECQLSHKTTCSVKSQLISN